MPFFNLHREGNALENIVRKPKSWLKAPRHRRSRINEAELRELANSLVSIGFINPIECLPDGEIISGDRRAMAAMLDERITDVDVKIVSDPLTAKEIRIRRISENLQRADLSFWDKYQECRGFIEDEPGITGKAIATALSVDESSITRYLCLDRCIEEVKQAAKAERIGMKACYEISKEPLERQAELLANALSGGAVQVAKARKQRNGAGAAVKAAKIKIALPSGVLITMAGEEMSIRGYPRAGRCPGRNAESGEARTRCSNVSSGVP